MHFSIMFVLQYKNKGVTYFSLAKYRHLFCTSAVLKLSFYKEISFSADTGGCMGLFRYFQMDYGVTKQENVQRRVNRRSRDSLLRDNTLPKR